MNIVGFIVICVVAVGIVLTFIRVWDFVQKKMESRSKDGSVARNTGSGSDPVDRITGSGSNPAGRNTGSANKPAEVKIQKKSTSLLRFKTPQGSGTCDPDTGELYWEGKPIPLKEGVAALAEAYPGWDFNEVIRLLDRKKGRKKLKPLFAETIGFDETAYIELGTILNEAQKGGWFSPEKRAYQSRNHTNEYWLVQYISGIPVKKMEYRAEDFEITLRKSLEAKNANEEQIKIILERVFPVKTLQLSELRAPDTENVPLPELSEKETERIDKIAERFFDDQETVLQKPSSDLQADRRLAVRRLIQFLDAVDVEEFPFQAYSCFPRIEVRKNMLEIELAHWESSCYDGGAGGTWDHYINMKLERMDLDICWLRYRYGLSEGELEKAKQFVSYRGTLPGEDCECLIDVWRNGFGKLLFDSFYLCNPFGLQGIYRFRVLRETI